MCPLFDGNKSVAKQNGTSLKFQFCCLIIPENRIRHSEMVAVKTYQKHFIVRWAKIWEGLLIHFLIHELYDLEIELERVLTLQTSCEKFGLLLRVDWTRPWLIIIRVYPLLEEIGIYIQFHWQFLITNSDFWLVNILLQKFDTSSKNEMKMIKTRTYWWEATKKCQKIYMYICKYCDILRTTFYRIPLVVASATRCSFGLI